jgi:hypothetical protein
MAGREPARWPVRSRTALTLHLVRRQQPRQEGTTGRPVDGADQGLDRNQAVKQPDLSKVRERLRSEACRDCGLAKARRHD